MRAGASIDHQRERTNGQAVLQFKPVDSVVATADYTYTFYKDIESDAHLRCLVRLRSEPHQRHHQSPGTVTNLVDTGSDDSYFASNDEHHEPERLRRLQLEVAGIGQHLGRIRRASLLRRFGRRGLGQRTTSASSVRSRKLRSTSALPWVPHFRRAARVPVSPRRQPDSDHFLDLRAALHHEQSRHQTRSSRCSARPITPFSATVIEEALLDATWKNSDSDSGLKSIKPGIDFKRMTTRGRDLQQRQFRLGLLQRRGTRVDPGESRSPRSPSCSILKQFSGGGCGIAVPYFYTFSLPSAITATQAAADKVSRRDGNFPPYTFAQSSVADQRRSHPGGHAGAVRADGFRYGLRRHAVQGLAGMRYEKSTVTANSLQKVPVSVSWNNPTEFSTNYAANATYSDVKSSYGEFLPNLDLSLQVLPDVVLRASYSKTIARSDLTQMIGTTSVTITPKPGSRTATAGNPGLLPYESNNIDLRREWYYAKGSYLAANWFTKHVTNFLTSTTTTRAAVRHHGPERGCDRATRRLRS